jgi:hypothetical protein
MFDQNAYKEFYSSNFYIDALQQTKSVLTDKVITDPTLNKVAHTFIDAQIKFAKMITDSMATISNYGIASVYQTSTPKKTEKQKAK